MPEYSDEEVRAAVRADMADRKRRRDANRELLRSVDPSYKSLQGTPVSPQDHPANNVSHPHGNFGRPDATINPMSGQPLSNNTGSLPQALGIDDF